MTTVIDFKELKERHRRLWAAGDYAQSARYIGPVGPDLLRRLSIAPGDRVLDVATGTGLAAIPAAHAGADVTGLDLTPELLEVAKRRAEQESVRVTWVQGDAEALPFEDESFDCVLSTFGVQFAPRHGHTAEEMARVCVPGGTLALCNWTPNGFIGSVLKAVGRCMPVPRARHFPPCGATASTSRRSSVRPSSCASTWRARISRATPHRSSSTSSRAGTDR